MRSRSANRSGRKATEHEKRAERFMIRKLKTGEYRLYSIAKDARTGRRRNLGTFKTLEAAKQHEREIQYFKHHPG
jgi:hypothetical protein